MKHNLCEKTFVAVFVKSCGSGSPLRSVVVIKQNTVLLSKPLGLFLSLRLAQKLHLDCHSFHRVLPPPFPDRNAVAEQPQATVLVSRENPTNVTWV